MSTTTVPFTASQVSHDDSREGNIFRNVVNSCSSSMKSPLQSITGLADLLNELQTQEEKAIVLKLIKQKTAQVERLLEELQRFVLDPGRLGG